MPVFLAFRVFVCAAFVAFGYVVAAVLVDAFVGAAECGVKWSSLPAHPGFYAGFVPVVFVERHQATASRLRASWVMASRVAAARPRCPPYIGAGWLAITCPYCSRYARASGVGL